MLLEASAAVSPLASFRATPSLSGVTLLPRRPAFSLSFSGLPNGAMRRSSSSLAVANSGQALTGVVFRPLEEIGKELALPPTSPDLSLGRQKYANECESAINQQIKFFKESSEEEREHAEKLMEYQNKHRGRVKLQSLCHYLNSIIPRRETHCMTFSGDIVLLCYNHGIDFGS